MTETSPIFQSHSNLKKTQIKSSLKEKAEETKHTNALSSSSLDSSFENINYEIKSIIENEHNLSFSSDSNSELAENKANIEYLFNNKFWRENTNKVPEIKEKNKKCIIPTPIKCSGNKTRGGVSEGSNKQSTQSNEDEENPGEHLQNVSSFESNNNSSSHNESEEKEKEKNRRRKKRKRKYYY